MISLYSLLEKNFETSGILYLKRKIADRSSSFGWLEPPESKGNLTVVDVHAAGDDFVAHKRLVNEWARST